MGSCEKLCSSPCGPSDEGRLRVLELLNGSGVGRKAGVSAERRPSEEESRFLRRPVRGAISRLKNKRVGFFSNGGEMGLGFRTSQGTFEGGCKPPLKPPCNIFFPPFRLEEGLFYSPPFYLSSTDFMVVIFGP